ncbi:MULTISPECIES: zinc-dependent alcohol dehydrogenase family protein [unclassified Bradyrhizobium]|jgi:NADPH:quinone reductase-like Zn-dependent oxidoreductase|uniref:zinc-dependent alcohol dehydrogenase family protein n=1 Tax=unclassified Bradyrhizobium TaxID=2631580 RepID=UPI00037AE9EE|nr:MULTISPECIES: zinc-dependent alcohol dehydrogenase family protein [unclassified Bradyrhizobium]MCK1273339.1 zinc-dependent alcohol dehydrogenase family protein [Bradyrhizobium sp. 84]MCK1323388.1 zinc-dependent alcohol dehydrogenase family protein [Bradyrhizobium sp. 156]MCK1328692.1 zinc-dependent alcohol dehydrogenase family protein [Bradyrhizobium sp. CW9]MCK1350942.1 zinc-dependent alcohol dehydrogenase family protein [Bradyrhizobium sp. CW7]MCK1376317.1 zinc-dependent alcohol dehydroge
MARVVRFRRHGGPEVLRIETVDVAPPGRREVQIRVKALGLNRAEALLRKGTYIETATFPSGLGLEAAGIVEAIGEGVSGFSPGEVVSIVPPVSMVRWPAYGELVTFPAEFVVKHPPELGFDAAAAVWMQYLTAFGALVDIAGLERGESVVITAASSSVGLAAIQIANRIGAIPIAVTRTSIKRQALRDAGAADVIASVEEDIRSRLQDIVGSNGVRVVFDAVGGPIFGPLTAAMSPGGVLIEYGGLSPEPTPFPLVNVLTKSLTLRGYLVHEIIRDPARLANAKTFILDGLRDGALQPIIAKTFQFEEIVEAHRFLESNEQFGKIVVTI